MFNRKKKQTAETAPEQNDEEVFDSRTEVAPVHPDNYLQSLDQQPDWIDEDPEEGQLSVDVFQDGDMIVVKSTIAGVEPEDIDVTLNNDMLTIRGERKQEQKIKKKDYFYQECYWGSFSRSIILPADVDPKRINATIRNGILTITLPKIKHEQRKSIRVKDKN